jgi:hypothetical protein
MVPFSQMRAALAGKDNKISELQVWKRKYTNYFYWKLKWVDNNLRLWLFSLIWTGWNQNIVSWERWHDGCKYAALGTLFSTFCHYSSVLCDFFVFLPGPPHAGCFVSPFNVVYLMLPYLIAIQLENWELADEVDRIRVCGLSFET